MREIAWIEREGGGPVRVRVRDRILIDNYRAGGGGPVRVRARVRVRIDNEFEFEFRSTTIIEPGGVGPVRVRVRIDNHI